MTQTNKKYEAAFGNSKVRLWEIETIPENPGGPSPGIRDDHPWKYGKAIPGNHGTNISIALAVY